VKKKNLDWVAWVLVILGALNWGFIGVAGLNVVESILGTTGTLVQFTYILVGLGGLYELWKAISAKKK